MKKFKPVTLPFPLCSQHVDEFEKLLASTDERAERGDVLPFLQRIGR